MNGKFIFLMLCFSTILILGLIFQFKEWLRLRNGCGKHIWEYHYIVNDSCVRICKKCEIRQFRLSDEYFWGEPIKYDT